MVKKTLMELMDENLGKVLSLYHGTTKLLGSSGFRIKGNAGYGVYLAGDKKHSLKYGDILYKVKVRPKNTLTFNDNEVWRKGFFNMSKEWYDKYINDGYDSISWVVGGKIKEFIVLDLSIIVDIDYV